MAAPTLDGTATGQSSSSTTTAATLTTSSTNDIVCALVAVETGSGTLPYVTGVAGGGLTWQKRSGIATNQHTVPGAAGNTSCSIDLWWAVAASTLSSTTITATFNTSCDDSAILVFGVNGCHTAQPWDPNVTLPALLPWVGVNTPSFVNISTSNANDFLIFGMADNAGTGAIGTVPTGFSTIGFQENGGGSLFCCVGAAYQGVTSAQSNQTYTWGSAWTRPFSVFDALTADSSVLNLAPQLEAINSFNASGASTNSVHIVSPSTTSTIMLVSYCQGGGGGPAITGISGGSLSWTLRGTSHGSSRGRIEVWTAPVTSGLAPTSATVTYASSFDDCTISAITWLNCNSSIWDSNGSIPAVLSNTAPVTSWTPSISGVSTSQATDLIMAIVGTSYFTGSGQTSPPTNFRLISQAQNSGGALGDNFGLAIMPVGATTSSQTYAWGAAVTDDSGSNAGGEFYIDAFTSASSSMDGSDSISGVVGTGSAGTPAISAPVSISGVSGTGIAGTLADLAVSLSIVSGGLVREVLETGTGVVFSGGVVREVLSTTPAHVLVATVLTEVLVSTISNLVSGGVVREVLKSGSDVLAGVSGTGHAGTIASPLAGSPIVGVAATGRAGTVGLILSGAFGTGQAGTVTTLLFGPTGVFATGRAGRVGLSLDGVFGAGQAGTVTPLPLESPTLIGVSGSGLAGQAYLVLSAVFGTGQAGSILLSPSPTPIGVAHVGHAGILVTETSQLAVLHGSFGTGRAGTASITRTQSPTGRPIGVHGTGFAGIPRAITTQLTMKSFVVFETPSVNVFLNPPLPSRPGGFDLREPYANKQPEERVPFNADDALHMTVTSQAELGSPPQIAKYFSVNTPSTSVTLYFDFICQSANAVLVYLDGLRTVLGTDYTVDYFGRTVTISVQPNIQHSIMVHAFGFGGTSVISDASYLTFTSNPLLIGFPTVTSDVNVVVNGTSLTSGYSVTGNQVTLASPPSVDSDVAVVTFSGGESTATLISVQTLAYNGGQTWTLVPRDTDTAPETSGTIVEVNGLRLTPGTDYTVTTGVLLISATLSVSDTITVTLFTNAASMGIVTSVGSSNPIPVAPPYAYDLNYTIVWMNGRVLVPGIDYEIVPSIAADPYTRNLYGSGTYSQSAPYARGQYGVGPYSAYAPMGASLIIIPPIVGTVVAMVFTKTPATSLVQWMVNSRLPASVRMPPARDSIGKQLIGYATHNPTAPEPLFRLLDEYVSISPFTGGALAAELQPDDVTITVDLFLANLSAKLSPSDPLTIPGLKPGSVWIGSERIEYFGYSRTGNVVTLAQLRRGTRCTSIEEQRRVLTAIGTGSPQTIIFNNGVGAIEVLADRNYLGFTMTVIFGNSNVTFTAPIGAFVTVALTTGYTYAPGIPVYNGDIVFSPPVH